VPKIQGFFFFKNPIYPNLLRSYLLFYFLVSCSQNNGVYGDGDIEVEEEVEVIDDEKLDLTEELPFTCSDRKLSNISAISAGGRNHTCSLLNSGGVKCWGWNKYGQLGDGSNVNKNVSVEVVGLSSGVNAISSGGAHTCAVLEGGYAKCWGNNFQLVAPNLVIFKICQQKFATEKIFALKLKIR